MTAESTSGPSGTLPTASPRASARSRGRRGRRSEVAPLRGLLPLAIVLAAWELLEHGRQSVFFPPPSQWYASVKQLQQGHVLMGAIGGTARTFALSLVVATVIGTVLGILAYEMKVVREDDVLQHIVEQEGAGLVDLRNYETSDEIKKSLDLGACWATW